MTYLNWYLTSPLSILAAQLFTALYATMLLVERPGHWAKWVRVMFAAFIGGALWLLGTEVALEA